MEAFDEVRVEPAESLPLPQDERGGRSDEQSGAKRTGAEGGCGRVLVSWTGPGRSWVVLAGGTVRALGLRGVMRAVARADGAARIAWVISVFRVFAGGTVRALGLRGVCRAVAPDGAARMAWWPISNAILRQIHQKSNGKSLENLKENPLEF